MVRRLSYRISCRYPTSRQHERTGPMFSRGSLFHQPCQCSPTRSPPSSHQARTRLFLPLFFTSTSFCARNNWDCHPNTTTGPKVLVRMLWSDSQPFRSRADKHCKILHLRLQGNKHIFIQKCKLLDGDNWIYYKSDFIRLTLRHRFIPQPTLPWRESCM